MTNKPITKLVGIVSGYSEKLGAELEFEIYAIEDGGVCGKFADEQKVIQFDNLEHLTITIKKFFIKEYKVARKNVTFTAATD